MTDHPLHGDRRQELMASVLRALGRASPASGVHPPAVDEAVARLAKPGDDLVGLFLERARAVGMMPRLLEAANAAAAVVEVLMQRGARRVVTSVSRVAALTDLDLRLEQAGFQVIGWRSEGGFDRQFDVDAGITDVHAALAETGTLVCNSDADHSRGLSLLPPTHIALVPASAILPDMIDYWRTFQTASTPDLPSSICLITGPSKTADIEGELVTGVHGPEVVHVLVLRDA